MVKNSQNSNRNSALIMALRACMSLIGVIFISLGATFLKEGFVGLDPFTATNIGLSKMFGMGLGVVQLSFNIIIFVIVVILDRHEIGLGTLFNMTIVGFGIQFFSQIYIDHTSAGMVHIPLIILDALLGFIGFTLGTSLYMGADLGVAPYDALAPIVVKKLTLPRVIAKRLGSKRLPYQWVRSFQDIAFMVLGLSVGGDIGLMTIVVAFFTGPFINFWNVHLSDKIVNYIDDFSRAKNQRAKLFGRGTVNIGKKSLSAIYRVYRNTNDVEQTVSLYSDKRLLGALEKTDNQIKLNGLNRAIINDKYRTIIKEINLRPDLKNTISSRKDKLD